ncbi:MAG: ATP synthase F1 subunit delta [Bacteroidales bacterium]|nr:ATP synthase F1 subunit delta [Bacteroidales bacterium]MCF8332754.1 ATP synthase F1 subunit delta [Bacteroidales bacterium]
MKNKRIAQRYAKAIFDLALEQNVFEQTNKDMQYLRELSQVKEYRNMLKNPIVPVDKKQSTSKTLLDNKVGELTIAFVSLIIRKERSYALPGIAEAFVEMYNTYKKILPVNIHTAVPINSKIRERVIEKIKEQTFSEEVLLNENVDEDLLGGFILRYKDKLYDASVKRQLSEMRKELI